MENKVLKQRIEALQKENSHLKKSLFELSTRYNYQANKLPPFTLESLETENEIDALFESRNHNSPEENIQKSFDRVNEAQNKSRYFSIKSDLRGHTGAVYAVRWSPCGRFIASGGFDKTARIWDPFADTPRESSLLDRHALNVSDICWSKDSIELVTGSYDQTCKIWDTELAKLVDSIDLEGFVQCVAFSPHNKNLVMAGTSRNTLFVLDRRDSYLKQSLKNNSMINTILPLENEFHILSGDASGYIKTWDIRTESCIMEHANESTRKPISHIAASSDNAYGEPPRLLAVNSYDNIMRIYKRTTQTDGEAWPYTVSLALKGYVNKNWPIRSSFFYRSSSGTTFMEHGGEKQEEQSLVATGSADPHIYLYDLSSGKGEICQRLDGHSDRVYSVNFHPKEMLLASCSADFSVKVWGVSKK